MAKKPTTAEPDPIGDMMTDEFVIATGKEAAAEARARLNKNGRDFYFGKDGKVFAKKPDGRVVPVVFNPKKNND